MSRPSGGIVIVGAGPAGLACATALTCHGFHDDLEVVDPSGTWLAAWDARFRAQAIPHLRSPAVHHPHPEPFALLEHARGTGLVPSGGTQLPTTRRFASFVHELVRDTGLHDRVVPAGVEGLQVDAGGRPTLSLDDGTSRRPDRVVLATNARTPSIPACLRDAVTDGRATSGDDADVTTTPAGGRVIVIGGGLSAAHLALGAVDRGATVTMVARRRLTVRRFDTHPGWLGPKKRRPFEQERDPHVRRRTIDGARGGGTIPHAVRRRLGLAVEAGQLTLRERVRPSGAIPDGDRIQVCLDDGTVLVADALWLATGGTVDVTTDPLCVPLAASFPTEVAGGLPVLAQDLTWPGTRVHLSGFATALVLGPTAGNLIGQRRAASRITASVRGEEPAHADRIVTGSRACPNGTSRARPAAAAAASVSVGAASDAGAPWHLRR